MTAKEIIEQKLTLRNEDLQILFDIKKSKASEMMVIIKNYSDRTGIKGRLHIQDYLDYMNRGDSK